MAAMGEPPLADAKVPGMARRHAGSDSGAADGDGGVSGPLPGFDLTGGKALFSGTLSIHATQDPAPSRVFCF